MIPFRFQDLYISLIWASKPYPTSTWLLTSLRVWLPRNLSVGEKSPTLLRNHYTQSYERGCQEKTLSPLLSSGSRPATCIQARLFLREDFWACSWDRCPFQA